MITPETAIEIVRNCDIKTEEMILKSEVLLFFFIQFYLNKQIL
jgi:hypothetical protein